MAFWKNVDIFIFVKRVFNLLTVSLKERDSCNVCKYWYFTASSIICLWGVEENIYVFVYLFNVSRIQNDKQSRKIKQLKFMGWQIKERRIFLCIPMSAREGCVIFLFVNWTLVGTEDILNQVPRYQEHKEHKNRALKHFLLSDWFD